jgi:hypothetical protein
MNSSKSVLAARFKCIYNQINIQFYVIQLKMGFLKTSLTRQVCNLFQDLWNTELFPHSLSRGKYMGGDRGSRRAKEMGGNQCKIMDPAFSHKYYVLSYFLYQ